MIHRGCPPPVGIWGCRSHQPSVIIDSSVTNLSRGIAEHSEIVPRPRGSPHPAADRHLQYGTVTGVGLDQAGIDGKLAADKPPRRSAPRHGLETTSQQVASRNRPYRFFATGTSLTNAREGSRLGADRGSNFSAD